MKPNVDVTVGGPVKPTNYKYKTVILKSNLPFAAQISDTYCKYVIKWDFDLDGEIITIPEGCLLFFDGGSVSNGTLNVGNLVNQDELVARPFSVVNVELVDFHPSRPVDYMSFGAKLNGIDNDFYAVKSAHDFANKYNIKVVCHNGKLLLHKVGSDYISIKTSTDLSGTNLIIDENSARYTIEIEESDNGFVDITPVFKSNYSEFSKNTHTLNCLSDSEYNNKFFILDTDIVLGTRMDQGVTMDYYKRECFTISDIGTLYDGGLICDYTSYTSGNRATLKYKSLNTPYININLPHFIYDVKGTTVGSYREGFIRCTRNNVNFYIDSEEYATFSSAPEVGIISTLFMVTNCANILLQGGSLTNTGINGGSYITTYQFAFSCCSNVLIDKLRATNGWQWISTDYTKLVRATNSVLNQVDSHFVTGSISVTDSTIVDGGIAIGYGHSPVTVKNVDFIISRDNGLFVNGLIISRSDLGLINDGDINISNINVKSNVTYPIDILSIYLKGSTTLQPSESESNGSISNITIDNIVSDKGFNILSLKDNAYNGGVQIPLNIRSLNIRNIVAESKVVNLFAFRRHGNAAYVNNDFIGDVHIVVALENIYSTYGILVNGGGVLRNKFVDSIRVSNVLCNNPSSIPSMLTDSLQSIIGTTAQVRIYNSKFYFIVGSSEFNMYCDSELSLGKGNVIDLRNARARDCLFEYNGDDYKNRTFSYNERTECYNNSLKGISDSSYKDIIAYLQFFNGPKGQRSFGISSIRNENYPKGFMFYDIELDKPVWHKGDNVWVYADGEIVPNE